MRILDILPLLASVSAQATFNPQYKDNGGTNSASLPLDISSLFDNRGFAMQPGDANFDQLNSGYPAQYLPPASFVYSGVNFSFPQYKSSGNDNALATGQIIQVPRGRYSSVQMLTAAETAQATGFINATYSDNSTTSGPILVDPFWDWPYPYGGDIIFPYYYSNSTTDYNRSMIFLRSNWLDSTKELVSLDVTEGSSNGPGGAAQDTRLHIFSLSLLQANGSGMNLNVRYARSTQMWMEGTNKTQLVEATIDNTGTEWILANQSVRINVDSPGLSTAVPGVINRLRPGDQARVQIGVINKPGIAEGTTGPATIQISGAGVNASSTFNATYGIAPYTPDYSSIYSHETPQWFNDAKFGIFIHWGVYSVPGWGNSGDNESYAEWYWHNMNEGPDTKDQTYQYNLATYGPNHTYDSFIQNFTATSFSPKDWVDLFADAGAQYFVQVSKHHDGYALFDLPATVSQRTSVSLPPHRNLLQELFAAAQTHQPQLHRATYFSLPEWFNPSYQPYGFSSWPGALALNPYTNTTLPYTGFVPVEDYLSDVLAPSMQVLADMGTEILWCDIGGPNLTTSFAAKWFNVAAQEGRQVVLNNRCGVPGDFDTPEYAAYDALQAPRKWESSAGMDPFSYGYNRATPDAAYITPQGIVSSLVDIVSKNGNFLLDVGPTAAGVIVDVEQRNLRAAGEWIRGHGEAVFNTTYWFVTPEEGEVRFTLNQNNFYILALERPNGSLVLSIPVPWVQGDEVSVVGGGMAGSVVPSRMLGDGRLGIEVGEEVVGADEYAWVFKIGFGGLERGEGGGSGNGNGTGVYATSGAGRSGDGMGRWVVLMSLLVSIIFGLV